MVGHPFCLVDLCHYLQEVLPLVVHLGDKVLPLGMSMWSSLLGVIKHVLWDVITLFGLHFRIVNNFF